MGQGESAETVDLKVFLGTWNLGNTTPPEDLSWIPNKEQYDIYAIGVQECIYEAREGFIDTEQDWFLSVHRHIGEDKYAVKGEQTLSPRTDKTFKTKSAFKVAVEKGKARASGIRLSVYIRKKLDKLVTDVEILRQTCGRLDGYSGNKGGISINLRIGDYGIAFVSSHLNAHMENCERRNNDYQRLCSSMHSPKILFDTEDGGIEEADSPNPDITSDIEVMNRHDVVFWFGDLNYRVELPLSDFAACRAQVIECISETNYAELIDSDQLKREQKATRAFAGYKEADITFPPTFKLKKGAKGDEDKYKDNRIPSYCDRVLYKHKPYVDMECESYESDLEFANTSDHTPVSASFRLAVVIPSGIKKTEHKHKVHKILIKDLKVKFNPTHLPPLLDSGARICVRAFHKLASEPGVTEPRTMDNLDWPYVALSSSHHMSHVCSFPVLFSVTSPDSVEARLSKLGEGMLSLAHDDLQKPFEIELVQNGLPYGTLTGRVEGVEQARERMSTYSK